MAAQSSTRSHASLAATGAAVLLLVLLWGHHQPVEPPPTATIHTCNPTTDSRCRNVTLLLHWDIPAVHRVTGVSSYGYQLGNKSKEITNTTRTGMMRGGILIHATVRTGEPVRIYAKAPRIEHRKGKVHCEIKVNGEWLEELDKDYASRPNANIDCSAIVP